MPTTQACCEVSSTYCERCRSHGCSTWSRCWRVDSKEDVQRVNGGCNRINPQTQLLSGNRKQLIYEQAWWVCGDLKAMSHTLLLLLLLQWLRNKPLATSLLVTEWRRCVEGKKWQREGGERWTGEADWSRADILWWKVTRGWTAVVTRWSIKDGGCSGFPNIDVGEGKKGKNKFNLVALQTH